MEQNIKDVAQQINVAQYINVAPIIKFVAHTTTVAHNSENVAQKKYCSPFMNIVPQRKKCRTKYQ